MGEKVETAVEVYSHDPDEADDVAEDLRDGICDMVAFGLEPGTVWKLQWSIAGFPTIMDIAILAKDPLCARLEPGLLLCLLDDQSAQTAVERGDGILPAIQVKLARDTLATLRAKWQQFSTSVSDLLLWRQGRCEVTMCHGKRCSRGELRTRQ